MILVVNVFLNKMDFICNFIMQCILFFQLCVLIYERFIKFNLFLFFQIYLGLIELMQVIEDFIYIVGMGMMDF